MMHYAGMLPGPVFSVSTTGIRAIDKAGISGWPAFGHDAGVIYNPGINWDQTTLWIYKMILDCYANRLQSSDHNQLWNMIKAYLLVINHTFWKIRHLLRWFSHLQTSIFSRGISQAAWASFSRRRSVGAAGGWTCAQQFILQKSKGKSKGPSRAKARLFGGWFIVVWLVKK